MSLMLKEGGGSSQPLFCYAGRYDGKGMLGCVSLKLADCRNLDSSETT